MSANSDIVQKQLQYQQDYQEYLEEQEELEKQKLQREIALLESKKQAADSAVRIEELYAGAIQAMTTYGSSINRDDEADFE